MFASDYFKNEMAKCIAGDGTLVNVVVADVRLVNNLNDKTLASDSYTGVLSFSQTATGKAKLDNDLTFAVDDKTVGAWIAENGAGTDLFGAALDPAEVFAGEGEYILEKDDTYIDISLAESE